MADSESVQVYVLLRSLNVHEHIHIAALDLRQLGVDEVVSVAITIRNCQIESLDASFLTFKEPVAFDDCHFGSVFCFSTYFMGGARFTRCTFDSHVTFECGGHNQPPAAFSLEACSFHEFVNFFDCWYPGPVVVTGCRFHAGSNLLGNVGQPFEASFAVPPMVVDTIGALDLNGG